VKKNSLILTLFLFPLFIFANKPLVYDCFIFFNELELLEIRLNELYDEVDHFVLVESIETFRGNVKPLYFQENKHLFKKFEDKIIHVVLRANIPTNDPWDREKFQRNQIIRGLKKCKLDDIIMISDVDEIPRREMIGIIKERIFENPASPITCLQKMYKINFNREYPEMWKGTTAITFGSLLKKTPEQLRRRKRYRAPTLDDAGWHFSSMGNHAQYVTKLESFSHSEEDIPKFKTVDHYEMERESYQWVPIDDSYPQYIQDNVDFYKERGLVESKPE